MTHHANQWILMLVALMVLVIVGLSGNVVGTVSFDKNNIISDAEFEDYTSMSQNAIQSFLESKGSALASYQTERAWNKNTNSWGDTTVIPASQIIYEASVDNRLNPKVILTMLHKEQSLIESGNLNGVNLACGYDPGNSYYSGFGKQVWSCAWQLRQFFDSAAVGDELIAVHDGNLPVYPANRATYALYRYNPSIGDPNDATSGQGGNYNFWLIWTRWGFGDVTQFTTPTLNLPTAFNQRNYNQQLGTCTGCTIASDGCAVTSLAMVLKYFGITVTIPPEHSSTGQKRIGMDPSVLDDWLTWNGGYSNGCLMKWTVLPPGVTASGRQYNPSTTGISPQTSAYFDNALANGDPVIAGVHWSGRKIDSHFVVITSRNGNTYNIIDPYGGVATTLDNGVLGQYIIDHYRSFSGPSQGGTPYVAISKTIRSDSDNIIDLTTSNPNDGSRDVLFRITLTNMGTADARVSTADNFANGKYYSADPNAPPTRTDVVVPAGGSYVWDYRARYQGSATADITPITNTARITWIHNYYNEVTGEDYGGHGALSSSKTAYIHNPSLHELTTAYFLDVGITNTVDKDGDGYYGSFDIKMDADTDADSLSVRVYINPPGVRSNYWTIYGEAYDYRYISFSGTEFGLSSEKYVNIIVELWAGSEKHDSWTLYNVPIDPKEGSSSQPSYGLSADLNCDGKVNAGDYGILLSFWGTDGSGATSCRPPDINQDGVVDSSDLGIMMSQWSE